MWNEHGKILTWLHFKTKYRKTYKNVDTIHTIILKSLLPGSNMKDCTSVGIDAKLHRSWFSEKGKDIFFATICCVWQEKKSKLSEKERKFWKYSRLCRT